MQTDATLLASVLLGVVKKGLKAVKLLSQQLPTLLGQTMLGVKPRANGPYIVAPHLPKF